MKRNLVIVAVVVLVVVGIGVGARLLGRGNSSNAPLEYVTVTRGTISEFVSATGSVEPSARSILSFEVSGRVVEITVTEGETVEKGDVLARLDDTDLNLALRSAEASLKAAEARYAQAKAGPSEAEIEAARASLESAIANYEKLKAGPSEDETAVAKANLERATAMLEQAQSAYDRIAWMPGAGASPQALQLQQATIDYEAALANYRLATAGASESALKAAEAQVAQARATLDRLERSPTPEELAIAESQVESARVAVDQAKRRLESLELRAPFAGVVEAVRVDVGQLVTAATPIVTVGDHSAFHIVVSVDELDISKLQVGQEASISLEALPGSDVRGHVDKIDVAGNQTTAVVTYDVQVALEPTEAPIRAGMSATVSISTSEKSNVLLLPNRMIQFDQETGARYVQVLRNGELTAVQIETGLRDDQYSEIVAGLSEGDQVTVDTASSAERLRTLFRPE